MLSVLLSPWHHLLAPPAHHTLVIDRMHSGARRFVVIDFGAPILLTGECWRAIERGGCRRALWFWVTAVGHVGVLGDDSFQGWGEGGGSAW